MCVACDMACDVACAWQAVTGDQGGAISVWHVPTGKLRYRFTNTHRGKQLTAINFDHAKRRLLTGVCVRVYVCCASTSR